MLKGMLRLTVSVMMIGGLAFALLGATPEDTCACNHYLYPCTTGYANVATD